jgi:hypothetical protein
MQRTKTGIFNNEASAVAFDGVSSLTKTQFCTLPLYLLQAGDFQNTASSVSCGQPIAGNVIRIDAGQYRMTQNVVLESEQSGLRIEGYADTGAPSRRAQSE